MSVIGKEVLYRLTREDLDALLAVPTARFVTAQFHQVLFPEVGLITTFQPLVVEQTLRWEATGAAKLEKVVQEVAEMISC